jgi:hypothetical protein
MLAIVAKRQRHWTVVPGTSYPLGRPPPCGRSPGRPGGIGGLSSALGVGAGVGGRGERRGLLRHGQVYPSSHDRRRSSRVRSSRRWNRRGPGGRRTGRCRCGRGSDRRRTTGRRTARCRTARCRTAEGRRLVGHVGALRTSAGERGAGLSGDGARSVGHAARRLRPARRDPRRGRHRAAGRPLVRLGVAAARPRRDQLQRAPSLQCTALHRPRDRRRRSSGACLRRLGPRRDHRHLPAEDLDVRRRGLEAGPGAGLRAAAERDRALAREGRAGATPPLHG